MARITKPLGGRYLVMRVQYSILPSYRTTRKMYSRLLLNWTRRGLLNMQQNVKSLFAQGQSVNLFFASGIDKALVNRVHLKAWKEGLKGLYYLRTTAGVVAEKVGTSVERNALKDFTDDDVCVSCQG
jgi:ribonucleotide reductase alpha subunit